MFGLCRFEKVTHFTYTLSLIKYPLSKSLKGSRFYKMQDTTSDIVVNL